MPRFKELLDELASECERLAEANQTLVRENSRLRGQPGDDTSRPCERRGADDRRDCGPPVDAEAKSNSPSDEKEQDEQDNASDACTQCHSCPDAAEIRQMSKRSSISSVTINQLKAGALADAFATRIKRSVSINTAMKSAGLTATASSSFVMNPERSRFLQRWNIVTMLALFYVAVVTPVEVAMLEGDLDAMFAISCIVDLVFLVDLVLQFFIMFPKQTDYGFVLEPRHSVIVKNYLQTWFAIDMISTIPLDLLRFMSDSEQGKTMKAIKVIRLLRVLKLARVLRASRIIHRIEVSSSISYGKIDLFKFFSILFIITHWLASLWALTLQLVDESDGIPRWIDSFTAQEESLSIKTKDSPWKLYVTCLYFTSYTITSVGYGDIGPANIVETVVAIVMIIIAGISWAIVLGQVCGIVANLDSDEQTFRRTMDELNFMMKDRVMPGALRHRLRSFFLSNKAARRRAQQQHIISSMSPGLRGEVVVAINRRWLASVSFLSQFMANASSSDQGRLFSAFVVEVSQEMQMRVHAQSEYFGTTHELYILIRGLVTHNGHLRRSGSVWGEDFVLSDSSLVEPPECFALTYVELTTLQRDTFLSIVEKHKDSCPELKRHVRHYCCWLAFQRALLREAKLRKQRLLNRRPWPVSREVKPPQRRSGKTSTPSPSNETACTEVHSPRDIEESSSGKVQDSEKGKPMPRRLAL